MLGTGVLLTAYLLTGSEAPLLMAGGTGALMLLVAPQLLGRAYDLFQPLTFVLWSVFIGVFLRTIYIITVDDTTTRDYLLLGQPPEFLTTAMIVVLVALAMFVLGYAVRFPARPRLDRLPLIRHDSWHPTRLAGVAVVLVTLSIVATTLYVQQMGIGSLSLDTLSTKRRLVVEGAEYRFAALGYYLWGSKLSAYAFYLLFTYVVTTRTRLLSPLGLLTLGLGMSSAILPIITSSRTEALLPLAYSALIWHYLRSTVRASSLLLILTIAMSGVILMGSLRALSQDRIEAIGDHIGVEAVLGTRHWLDVTKTAHIVDAVPRREDFQYGRTLVSWVFAPIPRTLWLDKPVIRSGQIIGQIIYEGQFVKTGVPPGFVAELYWNFGFVGVVIGMVVFGLGLRYLYEVFRPLLTRNRNALLLYVGLMLPFALQLLGGDLSGAVLQSATHAITMVAILAAVSTRAPAPRHVPSPDRAATGVRQAAQPGAKRPASTGTSTWSSAP